MDQAQPRSNPSEYASERDAPRRTRDPGEVLVEQGERRARDPRIPPTLDASERETWRLGRRAFDRGDDPVAVEHLGRLVADGHRFADVHYMLGMILERQGDEGAALPQLEEAIRLNPAYVEALLALASLYERSGDFDRSQDFAERARDLSRPTQDGPDPTTRGKLANQQAELGDALLAAGERREAIEQYRAALQRCPTYHDIRYRLGLALRDAGLSAQAAAEFQSILSVHPGLLVARIQLGLTWYMMGRTGAAVAEWNAILEADPSHEEARMYLRLVRGRASERTPDPRPSQVETAPVAPPHPEAERPAAEATDDIAFGRATKPDGEAPSPGWQRTPLKGEGRG